MNALGRSENQTIAETSPLPPILGYRSGEHELRGPRARDVLFGVGFASFCAFSAGLVLVGTFVLCNTAFWMYRSRNNLKGGPYLGDPFSVGELLADGAMSLFTLLCLVSTYTSFKAARQCFAKRPATQDAASAYDTEQAGYTK